MSTYDTEPGEDATFCRWCGEEIGIIHYGTEDRWQITPEMYEQCAEGPGGRHEPEGEDA